MKRIDFLARLSQELDARKVENPAEILADFDAHFAEALGDGQSEETVSQTLGDPGEIAEQCALDAQADIELPQPIPGQAEILVSLTSANLRLEPTPAAQLHVRIERRGLREALEAEQTQREDFLIEQSGGSLFVKQLREADIVSRILGMFESKTVVVGVPAGYGGSLQAGIKSGNCRISGVPSLSALSVTVTSGNTRVEGLTCGQMRLQTRSGNIKTEFCRGEMTADTTSGNVRINAHHGNVSAQCTSGGVKVETDALTRDAQFSAKSGQVSVRVERLEADLDLRCTSGGIQVAVQHLHGNLTGRTTSGNVTARLGEETQAIFNLGSSGSKNAFGNVATGEVDLPRVTLSARSGTVRVKKL